METYPCESQSGSRRRSEQEDRHEPQGQTRKQPSDRSLGYDQHTLGGADNELDGTSNRRAARGTNERKQRQEQQPSKFRRAMGQTSLAKLSQYLKDQILEDGDDPVDYFEVSDRRLGDIEEHMVERDYFGGSFEFWEKIRIRNNLPEHLWDEDGYKYRYSRVKSNGRATYRLMNNTPAAPTDPYYFESYDNRVKNLANEIWGKEAVDKKCNVQTKHTTSIARKSLSHLTVIISVQHDDNKKQAFFTEMRYELTRWVQRTLGIDRRLKISGADENYIEKMALPEFIQSEPQTEQDYYPSCFWTNRTFQKDSMILA